jgi:uncharacterized protein
MIGTILNVVGIAVGGTVGLSNRARLSPAMEAYSRAGLAALTVFYGLRLTWLGLNGSPLQVLKQFVILLLSMSLGKMLGRLLRLQRMSNSVGRQAREALTAAKPGEKHAFSEGFNLAAGLFCLAPLGLLGSVVDGLSLSQYFYPLAIKAVMDGLATMAFISIFGWSVVCSALPVLALQGTLTLVCARFLRPVLELHGLIDPVYAVSGMLIFCVALLMFDLKKIELADYLPSVAVAPLLTWLLTLW